MTVNSRQLGGETLRPQATVFNNKFPCTRCGKVRRLKRKPEGPNYCGPCKAYLRTTCECGLRRDHAGRCLD